MANYFLQTLISLLSFTALYLAAAEPRSFKLDFLQDKTLAAGGYIYQGDAHLVESPPSVRLTGGTEFPAQNSVGRVVLSEPIQFSSNGQQLTFESVLRFRISPFDSLPADGLTFFIAPVGTDIPQGSAGRNLGVFGPAGSNPNTLAIEFDTRCNPETDRSLFEAMPHVGIDIESLISSSSAMIGSAMIAQEVTATIRYEHATRLITVTVAAGNQIFEVSHVRDLSTVLTPQAQIGISAATGENAAFHDLLFWEFRPIRYDPVSTTTTQVV